MHILVFPAGHQQAFPLHAGVTAGGSGLGASGGVRQAAFTVAGVQHAQLLPRIVVLHLPSDLHDVVRVGGHVAHILIHRGALIEAIGVVRVAVTAMTAIHVPALLGEALDAGENAILLYLPFQLFDAIAQLTGLHHSVVLHLEDVQLLLIPQAVHLFAMLRLQSDQRGVRLLLCSRKNEMM